MYNLKLSLLSLRKFWSTTPSIQIKSKKERLKPLFAEWKGFEPSKRF